MDNNAFVRKLTIDMITNNPNQPLELFNALWDKIKITTLDVYHQSGGEFIYYIPGENYNSWIFFHDINLNRFWCNYYLYWRIAETTLSLDYRKVLEMTKILVEDKLHNTNLLPSFGENMDHMSDIFSNREIFPYCEYPPERSTSNNLLTGTHSFKYDKMADVINSILV